MGSMQTMEEVNKNVSWDDLLISLYFKLEYPKHGISYSMVEDDLKGLIRLLKMHAIILENRMNKPKDCVGEEIKKAIEQDSINDMFDEFKSWLEVVCRRKFDKKSQEELINEFVKNYSDDEGIEVLLVAVRKIAKHSKRYKALFEDDAIKMIADKQWKVR